ncbi:helix-turn-helix domain-containing protein [Streptomyces microflavus]
MPKDAAVEEFAGLVRALKSREGRSYEALGRQLSVSASALHRYCSGATPSGGVRRARPPRPSVRTRVSARGARDLPRARTSARITRPGGRTL